MFLYLETVQTLRIWSGSEDLGAKFYYTSVKAELTVADRHLACKSKKAIFVPGDCGLDIFGTQNVVDKCKFNF